MTFIDLHHGLKSVLVLV